MLCGISELDKLKLIQDDKNRKFRGFCLRDKELRLGSASKIRLIKSYLEFEETKGIYKDWIDIIIRGDDYGLSPMEKVDLVKDLNNIKELREQVKETNLGPVSEYESYIVKIINNPEYQQVFDSYQKSFLLQTISNLKVVDLFISNPHGSKFINPEDRVRVIFNTENEEYIRRCIENKNLYLGERGRISLISWLGEKETREYAKREDLLKEDERRKLILLSNDEEYIKECLHDSELHLYPTSKVKLIQRIKDKDERRRYIEDESIGLDIKAKDTLIRQDGTAEEIKEWESKIVTIKNISEVSIEELISNPQITMVKVDRGEDVEDNFYTKEEYIEIRNKMNEILDGINQPIIGDRDSELKCFLEITKRLAMHMSYNQFATQEEGKKDSDLQRTCRNLYGGLMDGECVCAGYAEILRNALACRGIEARYVFGSNPETGVGHAWNQVKIGDNWYNVDLTWGRDEIVRTGEVSPEILQSDQEFENHKKYSLYRSKEESCEVSMRKEKSLQTHSESKKRKNEDVEFD